MEQWILSFAKKQGWQTEPDEDFRRMVEELGEISREIRCLKEGRERPDETPVDVQLTKQNLASEIGDLLFPLIKIVNYYGYSLEECFSLHQEKMESRYQKKGEI